MTIKLEQLIQINQIFERFYNKTLPVKTSYKIMKFLEGANKDIQFFKEKLAELIDKYGEKDSEDRLILKDDNYKIKEDCIIDFNNDYAELQEIEIEIKDIIFTLDELESMELTPMELYIIKDFIEE